MCSSEVDFEPEDMSSNPAKSTNQLVPFFLEVPFFQKKKKRVYSTQVVRGVEFVFPPSGGQMIS